jgi:hypothetical protein
VSGSESSGETDGEYYSRADAFIALANEQAEMTPRSMVSASMLHAAARFNVYVAAMKSTCVEQLEASRDMLVGYYVESYKRSLRIHLDDFIQNFDAHTTPATINADPS